eukprot:SAG11_NODE_2232_length_3656_cov_3.028957_2_plen_70_part_00
MTCLQCPLRVDEARAHFAHCANLPRFGGGGGSEGGGSLCAAGAKSPKSTERPVWAASRILLEQLAIGLS